MKVPHSSATACPKRLACPWLVSHGCLLLPAPGWLAMAACYCLPQVFSVPLVGVWLRGLSCVDHPLVMAACLRFAYSSDGVLPDRCVQADGAFLLLLCPGGECGGGGGGSGFRGTGVSWGGRYGG